MALYTADTHALAWYWSGSDRLSPLAREVLDGAMHSLHEIIVSPLVLAELVVIAEKQRVVFDMTAAFTLLENAPGFRLVDLTAQMALRTQQLSALPDIHDRLIVATALEYEATLLTADSAIIASGIVPVAWG